MEILINGKKVELEIIVTDEGVEYDVTIDGVDHSSTIEDPCDCMLDFEFFQWLDELTK